MTNTPHSERGSQQFWEEMDKEYEKLKEEIAKIHGDMAKEEANRIYERIMNSIDKECDD